MKKLCLNLLLFALVCVAMAATPEPVIKSVGGGTVTGTNFGTQAGSVWLRPVALLTSATRAGGVDEQNYDKLLSRNDATNRFPVTGTSWSDKAIGFGFSAADRDGLLYLVVQRAADHGITVTANDFTFRYQVERPDGGMSNWF